VPPGGGERSRIKPGLTLLVGPRPFSRPGQGAARCLSHQKTAMSGHLKKGVNDENARPKRPPGKPRVGVEGEEAVEGQVIFFFFFSQVRVTAGGGGGGQQDWFRSRDVPIPSRETALSYFGRGRG